MNNRIRILLFGAIASLVFISGNVIAGLNLANGFATGQWYNPARNGEGFYVEVFGEGDNLQIAVAMYSFDADGNQLWLAGNVPIAAGDTVATVPVVTVDGPPWGTMGYDPLDANVDPFGTIMVQFPTCGSALFNVSSDVPGLDSGTYSLVRLTEIVGMDCVEPPPPDTGPPPSSSDITPGFWAGEGVCFFVNAEGTKIVEADECDTGKSFSAEIPGIQIDLDGRPDGEDCNANVACDAAWDIVTKTNTQGVETVEMTCVNEFGGVGFILFDTGSRARVRAYDGVDLDGRLCYGPDTVATPVQ